MKLDKEILHKPQGHKPDFKSFDYKDDPLGSTGLKSDNRIAKVNQKWISCDWKEKERDALQLRYLMDDEDALAAAELRHSKSMDDIKTCKEYPTNNLVVPYTKSPNKIESINMESEYYTDKSLVEYELPEFLVCYRENNHSVKDICVDDGVPQGKILFDSDVDEKAVCSFLFPDKDANEHTIKEERELHAPILNCLSSSEERDSDNELVHRCDLLHTSVEGEDEYDKAHNFAKDVSKDKVSFGEILSMKESTIENSHVMSSEKDEDAAQSQISQKTDLENSVLVQVAEEPKNCNNETFESLVPSYAAAKQSKDNSFVNGLSYNSKIIPSHELGSVTKTREAWWHNGFYGFHESENWSFINDGNSNSFAVSSQVQQETKVEELSQNDVLDRHKTLKTSIMVDEVTSDSEIVSSKVEYDIAKEEFPENSSNESCGTQNMLIVEDGISSLEAYSNHQNRHGESSFSGIHRLSSLINYSGPMASGNVSLRSESSTTSTRSFAFPVLQPEWNSSPVRMAKGDRRHLRKHGGWRQGLLCCRF